MGFPLGVRPFSRTGLSSGPGGLAAGSSPHWPWPNSWSFHVGLGEAKKPLLDGFLLVLVFFVCFLFFKHPEATCFFVLFASHPRVTAESRSPIGQFTGFPHEARVLTPFSMSTWAFNKVAGCVFLFGGREGGGGTSFLLGRL